MKKKQKIEINPLLSSGTRLLEMHKNLTPDDVIGVGSRKTVSQHPEDPHKAIREYHWKGTSARMLKEDFYIMKILHMIEPKFFPDIYCTLPNHSIDVVQKVNKTNSVFRLLFTSIASWQTLFIGNTLGIGMDTGSSENFLLDRNLNAVYVDTPICEDQRKLRSAILKKLSGQQRHTAMGYFRKYKKLYEV